MKIYDIRVKEHEYCTQVFTIKAKSISDAKSRTYKYCLKNKINVMEIDADELPLTKM